MVCVFPSAVGIDGASLGVECRHPFDAAMARRSTGSRKVIGRCGLGLSPVQLQRGWQLRSIDCPVGSPVTRLAPELTDYAPIDSERRVST
jgi:hypothetical protein